MYILYEKGQQMRVWLAKQVQKQRNFFLKLSKIGGDCREMGDGRALG